VPVAEYLIRPAAHDGWLVIPAAELADVLSPHGYDLQPGPGYGDLHLSAAGYEISFSGEEAGWQVIIEGDITDLDTDAVIAQIARQVQDFTQTAAEWFRYT
jgi:hypothetical protein